MATIDVLGLGPRYQGAWAEAAARLQSRQLVNVNFGAAVLAACAGVIGTMKPTLDDRWPIVLSVALVLLSWIYTLWIRHNDAILGLLSAHNQACERFADEKNDSGVPSWFRESQGWIKEARNYREFSDLAGIILCVLSSSPALGVAVGMFYRGHWLLATGLSMVGVLGLGSAKFLHGSKALRIRLSHAVLKREPNGTYELAIPPETKPTA